jgi:NUDIX domain
MTNRKRSAAVIIRGDLLLMVRERGRGPAGRHDGQEYWTLPGGGIQHGETGLEALTADFLYEAPHPSGWTSCYRVRVAAGEPTSAATTSRVTVRAWSDWTGYRCRAPLHRRTHSWCRPSSWRLRRHEQPAASIVQGTWLAARWQALNTAVSANGFANETHRDWEDGLRRWQRLTGAAAGQRDAPRCRRGLRRASWCS